MTQKANTEQERAGRYTKKPVTIEAVQWFKHGDHPDVRQVADSDHLYFTGMGGASLEDAHLYGVVGTLESPNHLVTPGDWIIRGVKGELYPCKPDVFAATYESEQAARRAPDQPQWPQFEQCQDAFDAAKNLYPQGNPLGGDHEWHWFQAGWNGRAPVVPDIPTKTMLKAAQKADCDYSPFNEWLQDNGRDFIAMYRAAISAAPATNGKQSA